MWRMGYSSALLRDTLKYKHDGKYTLSEHLWFMNILYFFFLFFFYFTWITLLSVQAGLLPLFCPSMLGLFFKYTMHV